ncbi:hypothetical protein AAY473_007405 [Plecturocebus cupreus]
MTRGLQVPPTEKALLLSNKEEPLGPARSLEGTPDKPRKMANGVEQDIGPAVSSWFPGEMTRGASSLCIYYWVGKPSDQGGEYPEELPARQSVYLAPAGHSSLRAFSLRDPLSLEPPPSASPPKLLPLGPPSGPPPSGAPSLQTPSLLVPPDSC